MHKRSRSSQLQGMEEGSMVRSSSWDWGGGQSSPSGSSGSSDRLNMALLIMLCWLLFLTFFVYSLLWKSSRETDMEMVVAETKQKQETNETNAMQGMPLGLSLGSIPFILKSQASYTEVGVFSLAGYPYSMKLLWSPLVDTIYSVKLGWRKSWVLPMQMSSGLLMLLSAKTADRWLETANIRSITILFFIFTLIAATQDIAVDGWALTLLSRKNIGHASTCQTIGINCGYFMSFTIFLALNDPGFCNSYIRSTPGPKGILTLSKYFNFWGWFFIATTVLLLYKSEKPHHNAKVSSISLSSQSTDTLPPYGNLERLAEKQAGQEDRGNYAKGLRRLLDTESEFIGGRMALTIQWVEVKQMYGRLWAVATLPNIHRLTIILLICKLGSITAEAVGVFKLMEKGVTRELVSLFVLIEFPLELIFAVFAGRWASKGRPFRPWLMGYYLRLGMAAVSTCLVALFPTGATLTSAPFFYLMIILSGVVTSFASTMMFVAQGNFFSRISDSSMGGTYLTLLNTIANFGSAWPKFFVFILLDTLTLHKCINAEVEDGGMHLSCVGSNRNPCTMAGGTCITTLDGFYPLSFGMVILGAIIGQLCSRKLPDLEMAKEAGWRA